MNADSLITFLRQFCEMSATLFGTSATLLQLDTIDGRWLDDRGDLLKNRHGVYIFSDRSGKVLYVGKANDSDLAARVWSHVGTPSEERKVSPTRDDIIVFPDVKWDSEAALVQSVKRGEFLVHPVQVDPKFFASLLEVAALSYCFSQGSLPPFNRRIG